MNSRTLTSFLAAWCFYCTLPAQLWDSVTTFDGWLRDINYDSTTGKLYVCGMFNHVGDSAAYHVAVYDGKTWDNVGNGAGAASNGQFYNVVGYKGDVFACGDFLELEGEPTVQRLGRWNGTEWVSCVENRFPGVFQEINGKLFLLNGYGDLDERLGKRVFTWNEDNEKFELFGDSLIFDDTGNFMKGAWYKGCYYFGGNFTLPGVFDEIMRFDGTHWRPVGNGIRGGSITWINTVVVYRDILFVGGWFRWQDGNASSFIMAWDGKKWFNPFPDIGFNGQIFALEVIDDVLFIGGGRMYATGSPAEHSFARYDGEMFCVMGNEETGLPQRIGRFGSEVYVAGGPFINPGSDSIAYFARWRGPQPTDVCVRQLLPSTPWVEVPEPAPSPHFYPNPTEGVFYLQVTSEEAKGEIIWSLSDALGCDISVPVSLNGNRLSFDLSGLATGMYGVRVVIDGEVKVGKIMKQ